MKVVLDIKENHVEMFLRFLKSLSYVQVGKLTDRQELIQLHKEAFENAKLIKDGKLKGRSAKQLLDEV